MLYLLFPVLLARCQEKRTPFLTGLETLQAEGFRSLRGRAVGVITNATGVDRQLMALPALLVATPGVRLVAIFAPEHGLRGEGAAGSPVADGVDRQTGVPVYSLYGQVKRPTPAMLQGIDLLLFDMQDIGVRTYTYLSTLTEALRAAAENQLELWVLDRPVPIAGDVIEGPLLEKGLESFVGPHAVPLRHGLTVGEFALMVNAERPIEANLRVVTMQGYRRERYFEATGLTWVAPSPNIPTVDAAILYAGTVLVEGTNLSEGRGTTRPFQLLGAPWIDGLRLAAELNAQNLPGCRFRPAAFVPSASKHAGKECGGVEIHLTERRSYRAVMTTVALIAAARRLHPDEFRFQAEAFDRLAGTASLRQAIEASLPLAEITTSWEGPLASYRERRRRFLLYP